MPKSKVGYPPASPHETRRRHDRLTAPPPADAPAEALDGDGIASLDRHWPVNTNVQRESVAAANDQSTTERPYRFATGTADFIPKFRPKRDAPNQFELIRAGYKNGLICIVAKRPKRISKPWHFVVNLDG